MLDVCDVGCEACSLCWWRILQGQGTRNSWTAAVRCLAQEHFGTAFQKTKVRDWLTPFNASDIYMALLLSEHKLGVCSNQQHCRWFILWEEWDTSGTCPYSHKERISAVKDTLFVQKALLLWRTRCSPRVVCDEITSLQGHWLYTLRRHTTTCARVENMQTQVNKTLQSGRYRSLCFLFSIFRIFWGTLSSIQ